LFSSHNSEFEPAETPFDWLSRDKEEVEKYRLAKGEIIPFVSK